MGIFLEVKFILFAYNYIIKYSYFVKSVFFCYNISNVLKKYNNHETALTRLGITLWRPAWYSYLAATESDRAEVSRARAYQKSLLLTSIFNLGLEWQPARLRPSVLRAILFPLHWVVALRWARRVTHIILFICESRKAAHDPVVAYSVGEKRQEK